MCLLHNTQSGIIKASDMDGNFHSDLKPMRRFCAAELVYSLC